MAGEQKELLSQIVELLRRENLSAIGPLLSESRSSDIAEVVELLDNDGRRVVFDILDKPLAAEILEKVDEATRSELFELLEDEELGRLVSELDPDDAADVLGELSEDESEEVFEHISEDHAAQIKGLMSYSEDSAGGIMDLSVLSVEETATIKEAVLRIRAAEVDENFFRVFVVDKNGKFLGDVRILTLLTGHENTKIKELLNTDSLYVNVDTDQEEVRNIFSKNDLIVVPVLDENHKLVGRITADRVIEVAEEEAAEDMYAMAGTDAAELESFSVVHAARVRMTWLLPCLAGTAVTAIIGLCYKNVFFNAQLIAVYGTMMAFIPMIAAISGNAGLQTSAIVVCGLATGDLAALKITQVFMREVRVALFVALSCGVVGGVLCATLAYAIPTDQGISGGPAEAGVATIIKNYEHLRIATAFTVAMFTAIMVATTLGLFLPFLFRRVGIDPAISSGPLVTTANDIISGAIYMTLTFVLST